jgi:hypothetical protein
MAQYGTVGLVGLGAWRAGSCGPAGGWSATTSRARHAHGDPPDSDRPRAPWQNPFVERLIGSIRRECLDHYLILNEAHLRRLLRSYIAYYNTARPPNRSTTTVPSHARCIHPSSGAWCPSRRSVDSITSTSGWPDRGRSPGPRSLICITTQHAARGGMTRVALLGTAEAVRSDPDRSRACRRKPIPSPRVRGSHRSVRGGF